MRIIFENIGAVVCGVFFGLILAGLFIGFNATVNDKEYHWRGLINPKKDKEK